MKDNDNLVDLPNTLDRELKKFFKTLYINLGKKDRFLEEAKKMQNSSHITIGKQGRAITLVGDEVKNYRQILKRLTSIYPLSKNFGKSYAEDGLKDAIWTSLSRDNYNDASKEGIRFVRDKYKIQLSPWNVFFPVSGIDFHRRKRWSFGSVTFMKRDDKELQKAFINSLFSATHQENSVNHFMKLTVIAADFDSAIKVGERIADLNIAVLNALADLSGITKHNRIFSSYMEIGESVHSFIFAGQEKITGSTRAMSYHLAGFNPHVFEGSSQYIKGFRIKKISMELKKMDNDLFQKRLLPALKWMGKALFQKTNEEAFLYYCLSFEAILFESDYTDGVTKHLQERAWRLLFTKGHYLGSSIDSFNEFARLYEIRSQIAHRGGAEVIEDDVLLMRNLTEGCLFKFLYDKSLLRIKTSAELEKWFTKKLKRKASI